MGAAFVVAGVAMGGCRATPGSPPVLQVDLDVGAILDGGSMASARPDRARPPDDGQVFRDAAGRRLVSRKVALAAVHRLPEVREELAVEPEIQIETMAPLTDCNDDCLWFVTLRRPGPPPVEIYLFLVDATNGNVLAVRDAFDEYGLDEWRRQRELRRRQP